MGEFLQNLSQVNWGETVAIMLTGVVVVFLVLIGLILLITVMGKIFTAIDNAKKNGSTKSKSKKEKHNDDSAAIIKQTQMNGKISADVIAAISGAVAVMLDGKPFVIKSVKRQRQARSQWASAGILENTRPFYNI